MKTIWEPKDVRAGRRVRRPGCNEVWMIGYDSHLISGASARLVLVSLRDGMISMKFKDAIDAAAHLNDASLQPIELVGEVKTADEN
jgi:hypothetical protein